METRNITQIRLWKLSLNPMNGRTEETRLVAWSDDKEKLMNWYKEQQSEERYADVQENYGFDNDTKTWYKTFKKGSPLEWYNPMDEFGESRYGQGISDEWVNEDVIENINIGERIR